MNGGSMYDKETKTFSFPYDQKRIDSMVYPLFAETEFHNDVRSIRNTYWNKCKVKMSDKKYMVGHKQVRAMDYWDSLLDTARFKVARISITILNNSKQVPIEKVNSNEH